MEAPSQGRMRGAFRLLRRMFLGSLLNLVLVFLPSTRDGPRISQLIPVLLSDSDDGEAAREIIHQKKINSLVSASEQPAVRTDFEFEATPSLQLPISTVESLATLPGNNDKSNDIRVTDNDSRQLSVTVSDSLTDLPGSIEENNKGSVMMPWLLISLSESFSNLPESSATSSEEKDKNSESESAKDSSCSTHTRSEQNRTKRLRRASSLKRSVEPSDSSSNSDDETRAVHKYGKDAQPKPKRLCSQRPLETDNCFRPHVAPYGSAAHSPPSL